MFTLKDNKEIGAYLSRLIRSRGYKSDRAFCKAYLEHEHREVNDDEVRKMANRMSQMLRGAKGKGVQIYDLPVFCDLLGVTCEEILSAGTSFVMNGSRETNYSIVFSQNPKDWEAYVQREDKLILNPDEYGKTVIDYAIEFKNYKFIKYLIKNNYIWFDSRKEDTYCMTFGAGTSIERRNPINVDTFFQYTRLQDDLLRMDIIALAVQNKDRQILDELRAREIPELYHKVNFWYCSQLDFYEKYNDDMIEQIIGATDEINMPGPRIDQLKKVIEASKKMDYKMGKGDSLPAIIEAIEAKIDDDSSDAAHMRNYGYCHDIYKHIMMNQSYLANSNKNGDNNIMIAYSLLSALDGKLAKSVKEKINNDPKNQVWLNIYNTLGRNSIDGSPRKTYMEDGPKLDEKYQIKQIDREDCNPLEENDLRKVENVRSIYNFLTKQGKTIFHTNTPEYEALCERMKLLVEYVDMAKDGAEKPIVDKSLSEIASIANIYLTAKLTESNDAGPKTPRGKARFAAAYAVLKITDPKTASGYMGDCSAIKDKFGNKLVDAVLKKAAETKIEVKPREQETVQEKASESVVAEPQAVEVVDVKPLIEEVKDANHCTKSEAIKKLGDRLISLQNMIDEKSDLERMRLMTEYVVVNEIKNQVFLKGDDEVIDKFNVEKNVEKLFDDSEFGRVLFLNSQEKKLDMKDFCKKLPEKLAEFNEDNKILKTVAENAFEKTEVQENKADPHDSVYSI